MSEIESTTQKLEINGQMTANALKNLGHESIGFENLHELWNHVLPQVSQEVSKPSFDTWIKPTKLLSYNESSSTVMITAPNTFARDWLENHYCPLMKGVLTQLTDKELLIEFVVHGEQESK